MSQSPRRKAMVEALSIITGLTTKEIGQKDHFLKLLRRADRGKGKFCRCQFGIFTFSYPRREKDGSCRPFLGVSVDIGRVEDWGNTTFPTFEPVVSKGLDIELSFDDASVKRFTARKAKQRAKRRRRKAEKREAAKGARKRGEESPFATAPAGAAIESIAAATVATA